MKPRLWMVSVDTPGNVAGLFDSFVEAANAVVDALDGRRRLDHNDGPVTYCINEVTTGSFGVFVGEQGWEFSEVPR